MPEGPEIRREADKIAAVLEGQSLRQAIFGLSRLRGRNLDDRTVETVETRGKALLIRFSGGLNLYSHNQLYGRWTVVRPGRQPPRTGRSLRVSLETRLGCALLYSASEIEWLEDADLAVHPYLSKLGPDVLASTTRPVDVERRLGSEPFRRRSLGALFVDQRFLSGVGNYLRSEILFVAGLAPGYRPAQLDAAQLQQLAHASLSISRRAYRTRGVTNAPGTVRSLKAEGLSRSAYRHFVFDREGLSCYDCADTIVRVQSAGRRLFFCPSCQP